MWDALAFEVLKRALLIEHSQAFQERFQNEKADVAIAGVRTVDEGIEQTSARSPPATPKEVIKITASDIAVEVEQ